MIAIVERADLFGWRSVGGRGGGKIALRNQALAVPYAAVHHELTEFCDILGADIQSPAAFFDPFGAVFPQGIGDSHGGEQAAVKQTHHALAADVANDGGQ